MIECAAFSEISTLRRVPLFPQRYANVNIFYLLKNDTLHFVCFRVTLNQSFPHLAHFVLSLEVKNEKLNK